MSPQTPKPEPSCPCCSSSNVRAPEIWEFSTTEFRCKDCFCVWDESKRTPATEPATAGPVEAEQITMHNRPEPTSDNWLIVRADEYEALRQIQFYAKGVYRSGEPRHCETRLLNFVEQLEELEKDPLCCSYIYRTHPPAAQPLPAGGVDEFALREIMTQAQIFASTWSLVGTRFDEGNCRDEAEKEKTILRDMIARSRLSRGEMADART